MQSVTIVCEHMHQRNHASNRYQDRRVGTFRTGRPFDVWID
jgi:hypothetical protein